MSDDRGFEYLDDPALPADVAAHSLRDIALSNKLFGGTRAILSEIRPVFKQLRRERAQHASLLDVGTGLADIPVALRKEAAHFEIQLATVGLEVTRSMAAIAQKRTPDIVAGDARQLPFADHSIDIVTCSLVLHHLAHDDAVQMLRECARVARVRVIIADLRRAWLPMALLWLVSFPLRFHPISRHDGIVSIKRGYQLHELRALLMRAGLMDAEYRGRPGWRVTASWQPGTTAT